VSDKAPTGEITLLFLMTAEIKDRILADYLFIIIALILVPLKSSILIIFILVRLHNSFLVTTVKAILFSVDILFIPTFIMRIVVIVVTLH
jgi:hypothetical protein